MSVCLDERRVYRLHERCARRRDDARVRPRPAAARPRSRLFSVVAQTARGDSRLSVAATLCALTTACSRCGADVISVKLVIDRRETESCPGDHKGACARPERTAGAANPCSAAPRARMISAPSGIRNGCDASRPSERLPAKSPGRNRAAKASRLRRRTALRAGVGGRDAAACFGALVDHAVRGSKCRSAIWYIEHGCSATRFSRRRELGCLGIE